MTKKEQLYLGMIARMLKDGYNIEDIMAKTKYSRDKIQYLIGKYNLSN